MISWLKYVPHSRRAAYEAAGWSFAADMGPTHGTYSVLMRWAGTGKPRIVKRTYRVGVVEEARAILRRRGETRRTISSAEAINTPLWQSVLSQAIERLSPSPVPNEYAEVQP